MQLPKLSTLLNKETSIAALAVMGIGVHLLMRFGLHSSDDFNRWPLFAVLALGGLPLVFDLAKAILKGKYGSDLLAGLSIVTSVLLGEYLAGALVVLMLSGGQALENFAVRSASSVLRALAKRMPSVAHRQQNGSLLDVQLDEVIVGDAIIVYPHETCPVDGVVLDGHGVMDESYLTGEPFMISKAPGAGVLSGAINGDSALTVQATQLPKDSRYAKIMEVMRAAEENRPNIRRLADRLGAFYTPVAVALAAFAWYLSGDSLRFLAVLVVATPCPLLIAIPIVLIGSISLAAQRGIIIRDPAVLEQIDNCRTILFDKTGTLTYGVPQLTEVITPDGKEGLDLLRVAASVEQYSKHPLAKAILADAREKKLLLVEAREISELPGQGLRGVVQGKSVEITSRKQILARHLATESDLPSPGSGLECLVLLDNAYAGLFRFHDAPRPETKSFIGHLGTRHRYNKVVLISGDRESEVRYLAEKVGITDVYYSTSPEEKVAITRRETELAPTMFLGDGINDAPALMTATVGVAFGRNSDVTTEAAGAVVLDTSLGKVDELFHIARRMRRIALESAIGGMALSILAMGFAAAGFLPPVAGAVTQEVIDVLAILNSLRAAFPPKVLADF